MKFLQIIFFKKNISIKRNKKIGNNDPKKTSCIPVDVAANTPINKIYLLTLSLMFCFFKYFKIKTNIHTWQKASIGSLELKAIWPKKTGKKNNIKKVMLPTFLLNNSSHNFLIPKIAHNEKDKLTR